MRASAFFAGCTLTRISRAARSTQVFFRYLREMLRFASSIALVCLSVPATAFFTGNAGLSLRTSSAALRGSNQFSSAVSQRSSARFYFEVLDRNCRSDRYSWRSFSEAELAKSRWLGSWLKSTGTCVGRTLSLATKQLSASTSCLGSQFLLSSALPQTRFCTCRI